MSAFLAHLRALLERLLLRYRVECLEAELAGAREDLNTAADRVEHLRRAVNLGRQELATSGRFRQSAYQLGGR